MIRRERKSPVRGDDADQERNNCFEKKGNQALGGKFLRRRKRGKEGSTAKYSTSREGPWREISQPDDA